MTVRLLEGTAEVCGVPLVEQRAYSWGRGAKFAVFTWYGCKLVVTGLPGGAGSSGGAASGSIAYTSDETPMVCCTFGGRAQPLHPVATSSGPVR